ncbi:MarR family transcriptional regulator [Erythrobacter sp. NFXS35]|uniref:MarR family transcriptional regulator n=1 Tax=Erythrobacter sp. NFXS35 TaxID=2818436 RepID=UPI0032DFC4F2
MTEIATASVGQYENRQAIAERLEALAIELRTISDDEMQTVPTESTLLALAGKIYSARRQVDEIFGMVGFAVSPAWDIMLDLYKAKAKGRPISVTSASIGAACPATTALRWLQALETMGLIQRREDGHDRRRIEIMLTDSAMVKMVKALETHL